MSARFVHARENDSAPTPRILWLINTVTAARTNASAESPTSNHARVRILSSFHDMLKVIENALVDRGCTYDRICQRVFTCFRFSDKITRKLYKKQVVFKFLTSIKDNQNHPSVPAVNDKNSRGVASRSGHDLLKNVAGRVDS